MNNEIEFSPGYPHQGVIEKYRIVPRGTSVKARKYVILPDGYFDLAFLVSESECRIFFAGPYTQKVIIPIDNYELLSIRFKLGRIPAIADLIPSELVNSFISVENVFGMSADSIGEMLTENRNVPDKQEVIDKILSRDEFSFIPQNKVFMQAVSVIKNRSGRIQVHEIADILNVSTRTLERQFKKSLGFPPKLFIRLVRFQEAVEKIRKPDRAQRLTDISYECGYSDQAHFNHDFMAFYGDTPSSFIEQ